jgi:hypothetical protein
MHSSRAMFTSRWWVLAPSLLAAASCAVDWEGQVAEGVERRRAGTDAGEGPDAVDDQAIETGEAGAASPTVEPVASDVEPEDRQLAEPDAEPAEPEAEAMEPVAPAASDFETGDVGEGAVEPATSITPLPPDAHFWLRADRGLTVDADGRVLAWQSQAGHGISAFAERDELAPRVEPDTATPLVTFDGTQELRVAELPPIGVLTFFAVAEAAVEDRKCPSILHLSNSQDGISQMADLEFGRHQRELYYESGAKSVPLGVMHTDSFSIDALHVLSVRHEPDALAVTRLDGRDVHSRAIDLPLEVSRSHNFIGHNNYYFNGALSCDRFLGRVAEIILYARALDERERSQVERYLSEKWSVPLQAAP